MDLGCEPLVILCILVDSDLEWMFCENPNITLDEVLGTMYPFITDEDDIITLTEIYNDYKVDETTEE